VVDAKILCVLICPGEVPDLPTLLSEKDASRVFDAAFGSDFTDSLSELYICGEDAPANELDLFTGVLQMVEAEFKIDALIGGSVTEEEDDSPAGKTFINSLRGRGSDLESDERRSDESEGRCGACCFAGSCGALEGLGDDVAVMIVRLYMFGI